MKHLHADLSNLFKRQLADLPAVQLPSGPAYIRPMRIAAIAANICYSYSVSWYGDDINVESFELTLKRALQLSLPKFRTNAWAEPSSQRWGYQYCTRYFRTVDDALLDAFIRYPDTHDRHPEFTRIKTTYPEYFI